MSLLFSPRREIGEFKKRYKWMALVVVLTFLVLAGRAVQLELIQLDHWTAIARENITKTITLPATRGLIRDTHGRMIAENRPAYKVYVIPQHMDMERDIPLLVQYLELDAAEKAALIKRIERVPASRRNHQIEVFPDLTMQQLAALEQHKTELPAVDVIATPVRNYPAGSLASHAIGYLNEVSADDLKRLTAQGYRPGDRVGRSGIEAAWESYLRGRSGFRRVLVDARGRAKSSAEDTLFGEPTRREPIPGRDLTLTLDMDLMRIVERSFRSQPSGGVVVVDVRTGRVRALFSKPSYDLNEMSGRLSSERAREIQENPFRPLIDKTIYETYFPGSTFKPVTAIAALEDNVRSADYHVDCPGFYELGNRRFRCLRSHGDVDLRRSLIQSCNVYFYRLAEQVGLDRLSRYAFELGLGRKTGIGINTEANGFIPTRAWYAQQYGNQFRLGFTLNEAIGQGNTRVSLIQLAMAYAALANGGILYVPQLVESVRAPNGDVLEEFPPRVRRRIAVSPENLRTIDEGLFGVVNDPTGTAYESRIADSVPVSGKTGTAQVSRTAARPGQDAREAAYFNQSHAWFAGFAPAEDPEIVVIVLVEHGGGGGKYAAPIALQIVREYLGPRTQAQTLTAQAQAALSEGAR